jgi:hypothetical protein
LPAVARRYLSGAAAALLIVAYALVRCGFGAYPGTGIMLDITHRLPSIEPLAPLAQTFQYSPIGPLLAFLVRAESRSAYLALHAVVLLGGSMWMAWLIARRWSPSVAMFVAVTFVVSQAGLVALAWVGSYDVYSLLLGSMVVVTSSDRVAAAAGFLAAFAVFEQVAISLALLTVVMHVVGDARRNRFLAGVAGAVAGRLVLTLVLHSNDVTHDRRRWLEEFGLEHFLEQFGDAVPLLLLTAFGGAWVIVVACLRVGAATWRARGVWIAALALPLVPTAITEDQSRVYAIVTWPIVLALLMTAVPALSVRQMRSIGIGALVLGLAIPPVFLWRGEPTLAEHHLWHLLPLG